MPNINYSLGLQLAELLIKKKRKLAVAESCTGGGLAEQITAVYGSSAWFECAFVTYSNESKQKMLGVSAKTLEKFGAVSAETAKEMAQGALKNSDADITISITGVAGPGGGTKEKPVGTVYFAIADRTGYCDARQGKFTSGRKHVRSLSIEFALKWLLERSIES